MCERSDRIAELATAAIFGVAAMLFVQSASPWLADNDSYYHIKMARLLPDVGFIDQFPWLHWTIFRERFVSHHHGFHAFLAPFAAASESLTGGLIAGAKFANIVAMSLTCVAFCSVLHRLNVRHGPAWLIVLACAPWHYWLRMSYIRAPMIALPMLLLALRLMLSGRSLLLAAVSFVLMQVYNGAVLMLLLPAALVLAGLLKRESARPALRQSAAIVAGLALGLIVHPYFPDNIEFLRTQIFATGLGAPSEAGIEWRRYDAGFLLMMGGPFLAIWLACLAYRLRSRAALSVHSVFLLLLNLMFLLLMFKARRFVEYWPVFAAISAAELVAIPRPTAARTHLPACTRYRTALVLAAIGLAMIAGVYNLSIARTNTRPSYDPEQVRGPMAFLAANSPADSIVFTDDWDVFPYCFYWNHHNRYIVGLDPVFTIKEYPRHWERYRLITRGQTPAALSDHEAADSRQYATLSDIGREFLADYVLIASDHPAFYRQLRNNPTTFRLVYPHKDVRHGDSQAPFSVFEVLADKPSGE